MYIGVIGTKPLLAVFFLNFYGRRFGNIGRAVHFEPCCLPFIGRDFFQLSDILVCIQDQDRFFPLSSLFMRSHGLKF